MQGSEGRDIMMIRRGLFCSDGDEITISRGHSRKLNATKSSEFKQCGMYQKD